VPAPMI